MIIGGVGPTTTEGRTKPACPKNPHPATEDLLSCTGRRKCRAAPSREELDPASHQLCLTLTLRQKTVSSCTVRRQMPRCTFHGGINWTLPRTNTAVTTHSVVPSRKGRHCLAPTLPRPHNTWCHPKREDTASHQRCPDHTQRGAIQEGAGHFRTSVRTSASPYLRTTKRGAEVRPKCGEIFKSAEVTSTERRHFKSVPPHLRHMRKDEILSPYLRT
ncbi:hypothetical protein E2C01_016265 [Portunus trituberculatus]|uniref:Uncharacterized protein n=1 Tax=Portunus trituberculatus TaxID=210409 RepID=A0A5B7DPT7_PORTR|nr:hypothetical protein [Portunus trituberculatus]